MESQRRPSARRRGERAPVAAHVPQEGCQRRRYRAGLRIHVAACDFPTADDLNLASEHTVRHSKIRYPCPLWVISGHVQCKRACPLYPQKRHQTRHHGMSALGQKRTSERLLSTSRRDKNDQRYLICVKTIGRRRAWLLILLKRSPGRR